MPPRPFAIHIVGAGRLGGALALALGRAGHRIATSRRSAAGRRATARLGVPGATFPVSEAEVVLLCVPDGAIAEVAEANAASFSHGQIVAHCSGAKELDVLAAAAARGARVGSLHPLCAVPSPRTALDGAAAAVEGDSATIRVLSRLARDAGLRPFRLPPERRALYHAAAVVASNGVVALAAEAARMFERCGLDRATATEALGPLMRSAVSGLEREGLPGALTGPIARGDASVIASHLEAMAELAPESAPLYRALGEILIGLSRELGAATPAQLEQIETLLAPRPRRRPRPG